MDAPPTKRPTCLWYSLLLVCALMFYVLSIGPVFWAMDRFDGDPEIAAVVYRPILWLCVHGPESVGSGIEWYLDVGSVGFWEIDRSTMMPAPIHAHAPLMHIDPPQLLGGGIRSSTT